MLNTSTSCRKCATKCTSVWQEGPYITVCVYKKGLITTWTGCCKFHVFCINIIKICVALKHYWTPPRDDPQPFCWPKLFYRELFCRPNNKHSQASPSTRRPSHLLRMTVSLIRKLQRTLSTLRACRNPFPVTTTWNDSETQEKSFLPLTMRALYFYLYF